MLWLFAPLLYVLIFCIFSEGAFHARGPLIPCLNQFVFFCCILEKSFVFYVLGKHHCITLYFAQKMQILYVGYLQ